MKRICFDGDPLFAEKVISDKIEKILFDLLQEGDVECWFYGCNRPIMDQAIEVIMKMRKSDSDIGIMVIDVVDPLKVEIDAFDPSEQEEIDSFPPKVVDRFVKAPVFEGKAEKNSTCFITHQKK